MEPSPRNLFYLTQTMLLTKQVVLVKEWLRTTLKLQLVHQVK